MIISYDNLITRLWLSGAIVPFEKGGYAVADDTIAGNIAVSDDADGEKTSTGAIDTLINERGLPPIPHEYWVGRLGFQQDDPVTDFRSGGVLSLAMLVHIVESCPAVHSRFVPKPKADFKMTPPTQTQTLDDNESPNNILTLEEIITDDASVLPFGITCINITGMLAKFLLFSKAVDKMDALLSSKPFWKMFIDPNAMLVLQEVSLDLLCDICVEIGRERRVKKLSAEREKNGGNSSEDGMEGGMPGMQDGKVTVFDFSEIMERTEKRVGDEVLGAGPKNVDELRAIARRVKSKYFMRIQLKEKHSISPANPLGKQIPPMPTKESMKNVTNSVIDGVGGFVNLLKIPSSRGGAGSAAAKGGPLTDVNDFPSDEKNDRNDQPVTPGGQEVEVHMNGSTSSPGDVGSQFSSPMSPTNPFVSSATTPLPKEAINKTYDTSEMDELDKLSAELGELSAETAEAFDLLGDDFDIDGADHSEELLDAMDVKVDPLAAFAIDDDDFLS